ncbi:Uncharacterized protein TCM_044341 [Theobroma cacao]|uniref:Secreted protein n=1 Tax=Theobroma cacao TaxID=3641 RepID=A0A061FWW7_THECC|nr:Uncharacterized protein TCM_044341 [Theobroma cacao]
MLIGLLSILGLHQVRMSPRTQTTTRGMVEQAAHVDAITRPYFSTIRGHGRQGRTTRFASEEPPTAISVDYSQRIETRIAMNQATQVDYSQRIETRIAMNQATQAEHETKKKREKAGERVAKWQLESEKERLCCYQFVKEKGCCWLPICAGKIRAGISLVHTHRHVQSTENSYRQIMAFCGNAPTNVVSAMTTRKLLRHR